MPIFNDLVADASPAAGDIFAFSLAGAAGSRKITFAELTTAIQAALTGGAFGTVYKPYSASGAIVTVAAGAGVAEQVLSVALPALGPNASVRVKYKVRKIGTAGTLSVNWKLNGTTLGGSGAVSPAATTLAIDGELFICNRNNAANQVGYASTLLGPGSSALPFAFLTGTVNTAVAGAALTLELTRANAGDTLSLEYHVVEIMDPDVDTGSSGGTGYATAYVATARAASMALSTAVSTHHRIPTLTVGDTFIDPTPLVDGMEGSILIQGGVDAAWGGRWSFGAAGSPDVSLLAATEAQLITWKYDSLADGGAGLLHACDGGAKVW